MLNNGGMQWHAIADWELWLAGNSLALFGHIIDSAVHSSVSDLMRESARMWISVT